MKDVGSFRRQSKVHKFAVFNKCDELSGIKIGLVNYAKDNWLPFSIGLNMGW